MPAKKLDGGRGSGAKSIGSSAGTDARAARASLARATFRAAHTVATGVISITDLQTSGAVRIRAAGIGRRWSLALLSGLVADLTSACEVKLAAFAILQNATVIVVALSRDAILPHLARQRIRATISFVAASSAVHAGLVGILRGVLAVVRQADLPGGPRSGVAEETLRAVADAGALLVELLESTRIGLLLLPRPAAGEEAERQDGERHAHRDGHELLHLLSFSLLL